MNWDEMIDFARKSAARPSDRKAPEPFPGKPQEELSPGEFLDRLTETAFRCSPKLLHPFASRLLRGEWRKDQIQEWVRQDYQRTIQGIRRHCLMAANAPDYEALWSLLTRAMQEADADAVGGTFFALPKLWIKFGIALGLVREEIVGFRPHPLLALLDESLVSEVRFSGALPVKDVVAAAVDPIFYRLWGEALQGSAGLRHDALDFFWSMAASRWGMEASRALLLRQSGSARDQEELWDRCRAEAEQDREWERFTILESILVSIPERP